MPPMCATARPQLAKADTALQAHQLVFNRLNLLSSMHLSKPGPRLRWSRSCRATRSRFNTMTGLSGNSADSIRLRRPPRLSAVGIDGFVVPEARTRTDEGAILP